MRIAIYDTSSPDSFVTNSRYLIRAGVDVIQLTEKNLVSNSGFVSSISPIIQREIKEKLEKIDPALIHIHAVRLPVLMGIITAAKNLDIPLVATLHTYKLLCPITQYVRRPTYSSCDSPFPSKHCWTCVKNKAIQEHNLSLTAYRQYMSLIRRTYRNVDSIIAISKSLYSLLASTGFNNLTYLPNPISDLFLNYNCKKDSQKIKIGYIGQHKDYKGVHILPAIAKHFPSIEVHVAGWGPLSDKLKGHGLDNFVFHGYLKREEMPEYVNSLDVILVPSIYSEACPGVVQEAFALSKPVVCFNLGGQGELVKLANGGLLVRPFSIPDFIEKINTLLSDKEKRRSLGSNGRSWLVSNCLPETHGSKLVQIYNKLLKNKL